VVLVETLHLFPMITLNVVDALGKIDPRWRRPRRAWGARLEEVLDGDAPAHHPGYIAGALLVFIWTFSDFATPLVLGVQDLLAPQAYLNIVQFVDKRIFRMGIVISALMVLLAVFFLLAARHYVGLKDYSSLSYSRIARRRLSAGQQALVRPSSASCSCSPSSPMSGWGWPRWEGLVAHAAAAGLHAPVLRAGHRGDAEIHPEQLPLLRHRGGHLHPGRRADRAGCSAARRCRAGARSTRSTP
jgi:hypothetical protein